MLWSNFMYLIIKVIAYENLVSASYLYVYDVASRTGECSELSLFKKHGRFLTLQEW